MAPDELAESLSSGRPFNLQGLRQPIFDEFKLVQDKIDRIGEFLFKIRTWAITANSGLVAAVLSEKISAHAVWIGVFATAAFWHMERNQRYLRDGYSDRALALEAAIRKIDSGGETASRCAAIARSVKHSLNKTLGVAASARRPYSWSKVRETGEDHIYCLQFIILIFLEIIMCFHREVALAKAGAVDLLSIAIERCNEFLSCG